MAEHDHRELDAAELALGGRSTELARGREAGKQRGAGKARADAVQLHVCEACSSELVFPIDWAPAAPRNWAVQLRCPECEWTGDGVYSQDVVDRFDEVLDEGTEAVLDDLMRLTHSNMEDEIERFVGALEANHILPEDF